MSASVSNLFKNLAKRPDIMGAVGGGLGGAFLGFTEGTARGGVRRGIEDALGMGALGTVAGGAAGLSWSLGQGPLHSGPLATGTLLVLRLDTEWLLGFGFGSWSEGLALGSRP